VIRLRSVGRLTVALLVVLVGLLGVPSRANAHGALRRSQPAAGAHLAAAPRELRLTFNEPVELSVARLQLLGPDSVPVALSPLRRGDSAAVIVADVVGPLVAGSYTVAWQIAGRDGHPVRDTFRFTIAPGATGLGAGADLPRPATDSSATAADPEHSAGHHDPVAMPTGEGFDAGSPLFAAVRWLGFVATLGLVGVLGFGLVVRPAAARRGGALFTLDEAARRLPALGIASGAALLIAAGLRLLAQSAAMHGTREALDLGLVSTMVTRTQWGTAWLLQLAAAVLAVIGFAVVRRRRAAWWTLALTSAAVAALSASLSGHAAGVPRATVLAVASDSLHVLAAGGWLGTLLILVAIGIPAARRAAPTERGRAVAAMVNAFSPLALACAAVVALTGVIGAWLHMGGLEALTASTYGRTLLLKLGVLSLVVATGAYNWRRVRPAVAEERGALRLQRSAWAELAVAVVVLAVTAVLVATPTPMDGTH
jgi:putative copper export protein/methionine-rich copper-binding protein CopC